MTAVPWKRVLRRREQMKETYARMVEDVATYAAAVDPNQGAMENDILRQEAAIELQIHSTFRLAVVDDLPMGMEYPEGRQGPLTSKIFFETADLQEMVWSRDHVMAPIFLIKQGWIKIKAQRFASMIDPQILAQRVSWCSLVNGQPGTPSRFWRLTVDMAWSEFGSEIGDIRGVAKAQTPQLKAGEEEGGCVIA